MTQTAQITTQKKVVSLEGLPDEVARAFELMVDTWKKKEARQKGHARRGSVAFAVWPGTVKGNLNRREIYDYL